MHSHSAAATPRQHGMADLFGWSPSPPVAPGETPRYPDIPGHKGARGGPSEQAAKIVAGYVTGRRAEVLDFIRQHGAPVTADDIAAQLRRSPLAIRPRVSELAAAGLIEPAAVRGVNESGMSANRWQIARAS